MTDQPMPTAGKVSVTEPFRHRFTHEGAARDMLGLERYGTALRTHNGRDAARDAWEEWYDLGKYLEQLRIEHTDALAEITRLQNLNESTRLVTAIFRGAATRLRANVARLDAENRALRSREWEPAPGHWYVAQTPNGRRMTCVGDIADIDHARLRVALQAAHDAACMAAMALRTPNPACRYTVANHTEHIGPCAINPSASAVVTAVLDAVAEALASEENA